MRKCIIDVEIRMKQHVDPNFLTWIQHYLQCYEVIEATNICDVPIFRHFIGYVKAHEKYLKVKHGKFGKMVKGMSSPAWSNQSFLRCCFYSDYQVEIDVVAYN